MKQRKSEPFEWYAAVLLVTGMVMLAPAGRFAPWVNHTVHTVVPLTGFFVLLVGIVCFIVTLVLRRPWVVAVVGVIAAAGIRQFIFWPPAVDAAWDTKFQQDLPRMRQAIELIRKDKVRGHVNLPPHLKSLTRAGYVNVYQNEQGRTWYTFPTVTYGVDNSTGFSWSESGLPPPRQALHEITRSRPLRDGWYMFWST